MRPLSFTKNLGGLDRVHTAIRSAYYPGITVPEFRRRCGLSPGLSLLVAEFFLCTHVRDGREYVVHDTLIEQTLARPKYDLTLARLYFFAVNLGMPGERLSADQQEAGALQKFILSEHVYVNDAWQMARLDKNKSLEPFVRNVEDFPSARKWVNNYWFMMIQCDFVTKPDGTVETFPDTWAHLALGLFFDRHILLHPTDDADKLVDSAYDYDLHELMGVDKSWLSSRIAGAADMFVRREPFEIDVGQETKVERDAASRGKPLPRPKPGSASARRATLSERLIRRGDNKKFIQSLYGGVCQISGTILRLSSNGFSIDCAHVRPLGSPHQGPDDVGNMLSLSPTMHRLFDRGCIYIDPEKFDIKLLHGNDQQHFPRLLINDRHGFRRDNLSYFNATCLR